MRGVVGEVDAARRAGCWREPGGDGDGVGALALHAQREGLDAAHGEVGIRRGRARGRRCGRAAQWFEVRFVGDDEAAHDVAVAGEVFGGAVDDDVGAEFQGAHQQRRGEGVVDHQGGAGGSAERGDAVDRRRRAAAGLEMVSISTAAGLASATMACSTAARSLMSTKRRFDAEAAP